MARARNRQSAAFTLIEMMISVVVLAVITMYMTGLLIQQSRGYEVVDDVAETQQAERAIGDLMEREVLATGLLVAAGGVISGVDNTGPAGFPVSDVFCVTDADAIANPTGISDAGLGIDITGASYDGTTSNDALDLASNSLEPTVAPAYDNSGPADGTLDTDFFFAPGTGQAGGVIVTNPSNPAAGSQCGLITNVQAGATPRVTVDWTVTFSGRTLVPAPAAVNVAGATQVAIPAHIYFVLPSTAVGVAPRLMRDGMLLADDIEDLQVAYFHDNDSDGNCDANEWSGGDCPAAGVQGFNAFQANAVNNCFLRAIRFNFVARTANQDAVVALDPALAPYAFVQTENAPARAGFDGFRRRPFSRTVIPRNSPINSGAVPRGCN
jgi:prepilin-type N-terminal cleavage/methylation domain-containing protein